MRAPLNLSLGLALLAAACAPTTPPPQRAAIAPPPPPPSRIGLERVLGATPDAVVTVLGSPTLDRTEGPARHLQFARGPCVLDLFFYPPQPGAQHLARHAEARFKDGRPLDAASCLQSQLRGQPVG